ncbi:MAG: hypothetical protein E7632_06805 [Ruminococcaceae bacterium]|nr:hypothetical protein [Oscillospiraceae bacterium]
MSIKSRQILAMLLLAAMAASVSCGSQGSETQTDDTTAALEDTTAAQTEPEEINRENAQLGLPELDFGETVINVLAAADDAVYGQDVMAEQTGDVVDEAVFARNIWIEELLNIKWNPVTYSSNTKETANNLAKVIMAGDDLYDLCSVHQAYSLAYVQEGYYADLSGDPYIDWEKPWWDAESMSEMTVGDSIYALIGDISLMRMKSLACVYYNKEICADIYKDADLMYDIVLDGKWTLDKLDEMSRDAYMDLNGNTVADVGDQFGSFVSVGKSVEHLFYAAGMTTTTKNADGIPEITMNNERTVDFVGKIYSFFYENEGVTVIPNDLDTFATEIEAFIGGDYLFAPIWFRHADELRTMETDYGIINFPKFTEDDEYRTLIHNGTTVYLVPEPSQKKDMIGAVCEAMGFYNYKHVTPAYYEVALKVKYTRDDKAAQVIDLISDSAYTNFGYVYASQSGSLAFMTYRSLMKSKSSDFASWYAKNIATCEGKFNEFVSFMK